MNDFNDYNSSHTRRRKMGRLSSSSPSKSNRSPIGNPHIIVTQRRTARKNPNLSDAPVFDLSEPTFKSIVSDLLWVVCGKLTKTLVFLKRFGPRFIRGILLLVVTFTVGFVILASTLTFLFIRNELKPICQVPSDIDMKLQANPPLVEYYVHGRGNGHYARSVAIVSELVDKGIDVRMFIGRATMYKAMTDIDHNHYQGNANDKDNTFTPGRKRKGEVTAISVSSLSPATNFVDSVSLSVERLMTDCEISRSTGRYPSLVISDGDLPGMLRAKFGSIPSVSVAHGQTFVIAQKPDWVSIDPILNKAWDKEKIKNKKASLFSDFIIGTNFVDMDVSPTNGYGYGVIARSPMRQEIMQMDKERQARRQKIQWMNKDGDVLRVGSSLQLNEDSFLSSRQIDSINKLLLGEEVVEAMKTIQKAIDTNEIEPLQDPKLTLRRRKIVLAYFRDKNGEKLTNFLLKSGFDVLLFERGYHKGIRDHEGEKQFGHSMIIQRSTQVEDFVDLSVMEYWKQTLEKYDHKLLEEDEMHLSVNEQAENIISSANATLIENAHGAHSEMTTEQALEILNKLMSHDKIQKPRIIRVSDMSLFVPFLSITDGVASSAGSQLLSESIFCQFHVLALHRDDDTEQRLNIEFGKHRFDRLSKTVESTRLENLEKENVIHGMSLEKFSLLLEKISAHLGDDDERMLLSEAEENLILSPEEKQLYLDFRRYVDSVQNSPISFSYYHDLFRSISNLSQANPIEFKSHSRQEKEDDVIDTLQGMPDASRVILEILADVTDTKINSKFPPSNELLIH